MCLTCTKLLSLILDATTLVSLLRRLWHCAEGFTDHDSMLCERFAHRHAPSSYFLAAGHPHFQQAQPACSPAHGHLRVACLCAGTPSIRTGVSCAGGKALGTVARRGSLSHLQAVLLTQPVCRHPWPGVQGPADFRRHASFECPIECNIPDQLDRGLLAQVPGQRASSAVAACLVKPTLCRRCVQAHTGRSTRLCATACRWWRSRSSTIWRIRASRGAS